MRAWLETQSQLQRWKAVNSAGQQSVQRLDRKALPYPVLPYPVQRGLQAIASLTGLQVGD
jgi:hypothetical protein